MKYICIQRHFYQPPRENPSLEAVELQDSAYPYHDWLKAKAGKVYDAILEADRLSEEHFSGHGALGKL